MALMDGIALKYSFDFILLEPSGAVLMQGTLQPGEQGDE
jgi:hypothetical protein